MSSEEARSAHSGREPSTSKNQSLIDMLKKDERTSFPWCEEFEKMISGLPFDSRKSIEMQEHKLKIERLLLEFNSTTIPFNAIYQSLQESRMAVLKQMVGQLGKGVNFKAPFYCTWGCNLFVGDNVFVNRGVSIHDSAPVIIGSRVHIGPGVSIQTESHGTDIVARRAGLLFAKPVKIDEDCWIGAEVMFLPGVTIGKGCTIGARSVVTHDIEPFSVAVGVPAKVIGKVTDPDDGENLQKHTKRLTLENDAS